MCIRDRSFVATHTVSDRDGRAVIDSELLFNWPLSLWPTSLWPTFRLPTFDLLTDLGRIRPGTNAKDWFSILASNIFASNILASNILVSNIVEPSLSSSPSSASSKKNLLRFRRFTKLGGRYLAIPTLYSRDRWPPKLLYKCTVLYSCMLVQYYLHLKARPWSDMATTTGRVWSTAPDKIASASGFSIMRWISRFSGLAP